MKPARAKRMLRWAVSIGLIAVLYSRVDLGGLEARLDERVRGSISERYAGAATVRQTPHPARLMLAHAFLNVLMSASTLLIAWLLYHALRRWPNVPRSHAVLAAPALVFGTIYFYWGNYVSTQIAAAAFLLLAFYLVEFAARPALAETRALLAGLALGLACFIDYSAALTSPVPLS